MIRLTASQASSAASLGWRDSHSSFCSSFCSIRRSYGRMKPVGTDEMPESRVNARDKPRQVVDASVRTVVQPVNIDKSECWAIASLIGGWRQGNCPFSSRSVAETALYGRYPVVSAFRLLRSGYFCSGKLRFVLNHLFHPSSISVTLHVLPFCARFIIQRHAHPVTESLSRLELCLINACR
jgi:hypothetical protein